MNDGRAEARAWRAWVVVASREEAVEVARKVRPVWGDRVRIRQLTRPPRGWAVYVYPRKAGEAD